MKATPLGHIGFNAKSCNGNEIVHKHKSAIESVLKITHSEGREESGKYELLYL